MTTRVRLPEPGRQLAAMCIALASAAVSAPALRAQAAPPSLVTRWAHDVRPGRVLPDYPRPQLVRRTWQNLNGWWDYALTPQDAPQPAAWDGRILVPFPIESQLSRVRRAVGEHDRLWYHRTFRAPRLATGGRLLLHFGAVDWDAAVYVNGTRIGGHTGGYDPFSFDVTDALRPGANQDLVVSVWDPTDRGPQPRGKQVQKPRGIWYTAVTGIWQTVWLEPVPREYVSGLVITPDVDAGAVVVRVAVAGGSAATRVRLTVLEGARPVASLEAPADSPVNLTIPHPRLWSPHDPFLYGLRVRLAGGDAVGSYFGMRKIAVARDSAGVNRLFLNGRPLFEFGTLDQGWWPDGLYTAPADAAIRFDLQTLRRLGFNLVRKHVKVEPERWYYWCDKLGLLVWQDMPSGGNDTPEGQREFAAELGRVVDALRNHPAIVMWVPFNEGWGQHDTGRYVAWLKQHDPSRLVDDASGWTDQSVGDVMDVHDYPGPGMPALEPQRAAVLGEFGGLGLPTAGHLWIERGAWGYRRFTTADSLWSAYRTLLARLRPLIGDGLAAAVYTQTTDVETEVNGLMTYDRAVVKLPARAAVEIARLYAPPGTLGTHQGARVSRAPFGATPAGQAVDVYTLTNAHGMEVRATTYGGIVVSLRVPDRMGHLGDVVLGYDSLAGYLRATPYFGAIIGRYGNRVAHAQFTLDGTTYHVPANDGANSLHGGTVGFDKVVWDAEPFWGDSGVGVAFTHTSPDGDQGYPGKLEVRVTYTLTHRNELVVDYHATTDRATPVNLTQHSYFNLAGDGSGDVLRQVLWINADRYTPVDSALIPTGALAPVAGTPFDFTTPTAIGARIALDDEQLRRGRGYDHNFVLSRTGPGLVHAARALDPASGRTLDLYTTEPGLQFYSGNFLDGSITGKAGHVYAHRNGFCLETQHFPDSPNESGFPSTILRPGEEYRSRTVFAFGVSP
jgi:galactose mutarotase-like enzyme